MKDEFNQEMGRAITTAVQAGQAIMDIYGDELEVSFKEDQSPLTLADRSSHKVIADCLLGTGLPLLSEEGKSVAFEVRKEWKTFWLVDPLDGTKEFIKRNGEFTVNIALISGQYPVFGVIYVPVNGVLYFGGKDLGAYRMDQPERTGGSFEQFRSLAQRIPDNRADGSYKVIASRSHMSPETSAHIDEIRKKKGDVTLLSRGSSLKLCLIAEGQAHEYPRFAPTMEWDTAAGQAIVEGAGGKVLHYPSGNRLPYNKENLLNDWFIAKIS